MRRIRPLVFALCLVAPFTAAAVAGADDRPDCHGQNEVDCRPDPNEHGQDCDPHGQHGESNDDHCATTTTTAATTTSSVAPTTTTLALTPVESATTTTAPAAVRSTRLERLPATGFPYLFLAVCAGLAIFFGLALRYANKLEGKG